jgi:DNA-binding SARP family transcriptional activator
MIRLQLLGPVGLWGSDGLEIRPALQQPKRLALLVYLVLAPRSGFCRRDTLLGLFWPEVDQEHARNALRQAIHFLRAALGSNVILGRGDELGIAPGALTCDVLAFRRLAEAGRQASTATGAICSRFLRGRARVRALAGAGEPRSDAAVAGRMAAGGEATGSDVAIQWACRRRATRR